MRVGDRLVIPGHQFYAPAADAIEMIRNASARLVTDADLAPLLDAYRAQPHGSTATPSNSQTR
jgi:hypothetical protein